MRILIAGVLGAVVLFLWGFVAHTMLPVGEMGMSQPQNEDAVLQAVQANLPTPGIYVMPYLNHDQMKDEAVANAWAEKAKANPYASRRANVQGLSPDGGRRGHGLRARSVTIVHSRRR